MFHLLPSFFLSAAAECVSHLDHGRPAANRALYLLWLKVHPLAKSMPRVWSLLQGSMNCERSLSIFPEDSVFVSSALTTHKGQPLSHLFFFGTSK